MVKQRLSFHDFTYVYSLSLSVVLSPVLLLTLNVTIVIIYTVPEIYRLTGGYLNVMRYRNSHFLTLLIDCNGFKTRLLSLSQNSLMSLMVLDLSILLQLATVFTTLCPDTKWTHYIEHRK